MWAVGWRWVPRGRCSQRLLSAVGGGIVPTPAAFANVSTPVLARSCFVLWLCSQTWLTKRAMKGLRVAESLIGPRITHAVLRRTLFKQFVAGESVDDIGGSIAQLRSVNVKCILDYAVEDDLQQAPPSDAEWDANVKSFLECIKAANKHECHIALKVTALGSPQLLEQTTRLLSKIWNMYHSFNESRNGHMTREEFHKGIGSTGIEVDAGGLTADELFDRIDREKTGTIEVLDWILFAAPERKPEHPIEMFIPHLEEPKRIQLQKILERLDTIATAASQAKVPVLIDAEHTFFQNAIDHVVTNLQRKYNRDGAAIISGTYQAYRVDCARRLKVDIDRAKREGFRFAAKLVRGAYMSEERARAASLGYPDPIHKDRESTTGEVYKCMDLFMNNTAHADLMVASHNAKSIEYATQRIDDLKLPKNCVKFAQLLGMADHVTLTLSAAGYATYKYVPFGPIGKVVPYLLRRAEENSVVTVGTTLERRLMRQELWKRVLRVFGIRS
ncbi:unnamed protein product (mitochondrion) [Plasmodiophora brassicae]|uniref:Proline dehydrogenase n=1 Tax=Plasmodiophora brassicae TaxID=37360 RepID=A0A0G4IVR2_PLABS|nr:hypothetical protein PBRA_001301 [Plasmodiophora brassicae]SPQ97401.1 unnamed protein product [Plasmodiophora brassicae]